MPTMLGDKPKTVDPDIDNAVEALIALIRSKTQRSHNEIWTIRMPFTVCMSNSGRTQCFMHELRLKRPHPASDVRTALEDAFTLGLEQMPFTFTIAWMIPNDTGVHLGIDVTPTPV